MSIIPKQYLRNLVFMIIAVMVTFTVTGCCGAFQQGFQEGLEESNKSSSPSQSAVTGVLVNTSGDSSTISNNFTLQVDCARFFVTYTATGNGREINQLMVAAIDVDTGSPKEVFVNETEYGQSASGKNGGYLEAGEYYLKIHEVNTSWNVSAKCEG